MVLQSVKMALKAILANKTRSFLTMLGIIIGVFSLVVLIALVNGATSYVTDSINSFGNDYVEILVNDDKGNPIDDDLLNEFNNMDIISEITPSLSLPAAVFTANGVERRGVLYGVDSPYFRLENLKIAYGRPISTVDNENSVRVAVIDSELSKKLFKTDNSVGQTLKINGINYKVIGVLAEKDSSFASMMNDDSYSVYIPSSCFTRHQEAHFNGYPELLASVNSDYEISEATETISDILYKRFNNDKEAFAVITMDQISQVLGGITSTLSAVFGGIAAISLLVGGIGIMNIMLVSVTERTKEIGIRKAIGASKKSILLQFLIEAFVISLTGCLIGLVFSYITVFLIDTVAKLMEFQLHFSIPLYSVFFAGGFSLLVGLVFGIYPANKAANKKPIEALRYDG